MTGIRRSGWLVVLGSGLALTVSQGPLINFTFGVFLKPLTDEFAVGRGTASVALMAGTLCSAFALPVTGYLADRLGPRHVAILASLLVGLLLTLVALLSNSIWTFGILFALLGLAASGISPLPYLKAVSTAFDERRGLALALALMGVGVGTIFVPVLAQQLITKFGWHVAYLGLALLSVSVAVPAIALFIPNRPHLPTPIAADSDHLVGLTVSEALKTRAFYLLAIGMFLGAAAANGTIAHVVPLLTDRGIPPAEALTTLALVGVSSMAGRLVGGVLLDRFWAPLVALLFFAGMVAGITLLAVGPTLVLSKVAVVLLGLGLGVEADLAGFLISRYLGLKAFGALFGIIFGAFLIASSLAPVLMGVLFDLTGAYTICLVIFAGFSFVAATTLLALGPYTYPLRRADSSNLA